MIATRTHRERGEQRLRLSAIPWETYVIYSDGLGERHIRVTYDRGEMEIMTLSPKHENRKKLLARFVEALTEEMNIDIASFGSMTCRRRDLERPRRRWALLGILDRTTKQLGRNRRDTRRRPRQGLLELA